MTILLIRHGETALNVGRVLQPPETPLSERGHRQAESLARRVSGEGLMGVLSSDLPRAVQTARTIAAACGLVVETTPLLQERNFGDWRGRPYDSLGFDPLARDSMPPQGESDAQFRQRIRRAFDEIQRRRARVAGPLAVVTHGLVIQALLDSHLALPADGAHPGRVGNTSLTICAAEPPFAISLLDCRRHLEEGLLEAPRSLSGG